MNLLIKAYREVLVSTHIISSLIQLRLILKLALIGNNYNFISQKFELGDSNVDTDSSLDNDLTALLDIQIFLLLLFFRTTCSYLKQCTTTFEWCYGDIHKTRTDCLWTGKCVYYHHSKMKS